MPDTLEQVMAELSKGYQIWVKQDLERLKKAYEDLPSTAEELFRIAHDMKGQGATFDYPLITIVGEKFCRWFEKKEILTDDDIQTAGKYVDLIETIIENKIMGQDSNRAKDIIQKLGNLDG